MATTQEASITIRAYDKASYAVLGVAANLEKLNKRMARTSQIGYAFGQIGKQLAPALDSMRNLGAKWSAAGSRLAITGLAVGGAAAGLVKFAASATDAADKIGDLSSRYQVSSKMLQVYGSLLEDNGASMEDTAAGIGKLKKAMGEAMSGDKEASAAFSGFGISVQKLKKMKPEEVMLAMADAFKGSDKDLAKQAILLQLMGKSGTIFMDTMNKGGEDYKKRLKEMAEDNALLDKKQIEFAGRFSDKWNRMSRSLGALKNRLGMALAERLEPLLGKFQNWLSGEGGKKIAAEFDKIFTSENIETFVAVLKGLWDVLKAVGRAFKALIDFMGPTATMFLVAGIALAPLISALVSTASALGSVLKVTLAIASAFPVLTAGATVAGAAIFSAFKAYQAYQRLSDSFDQSAQNKQVRDEKRTAYDKQLMTVVGGDALVKGMKNYDFQQLDQVMKGLEQGGKVVPGTAARLTSMRTEVGGTLKIDINSAGQAKVTEVNKKGALDFDVSTGPMMAGG